MKLRITVLIPAVLVVSALVGGALLFWQTMRAASGTIRQDALGQVKLDVTRLQNVLYNRLTEDNLQEARLNLSVTAMDPKIRTLLLADENDSVLLANRYLWESGPAAQVSTYDPVLAARVRGSNTASVAYDSNERNVLVGYYPVILKLEKGRGMPAKRIGVLYLEASIASELALARHEAIVRALVFSGIMLAASILVALLLHFLVSRRLARLTQAAQTLAAGDLQVRANVTGSDELAQVGAAFDEMVARIKDDVRRRQAVRQELRELNETLEQRVAERTALLGEAQRIGRIGNWSWDVASSRLLWSDEIYRIFGYEPGAMEPSYERFSATVHPDDLERVRRSEQAAFSQGQRHSIDHRILLPDGAIRWVHEEAIAILDKAGNAITLSGTVQDITDRKLIEENLLAAKVEAERANLAKSEFLSRMSHELRTPMNAILGFGQLLELEPLKADQADSVQEIMRAGRHLLELINEILDLASIEAGRLAISEAEVPLAALIEECLTLVRPLAVPKDIQLSVAGSCTGETVLADRTRLKQVLLNLLSNAVKYNRWQGAATLSCTRRDERVRISISDTGPGLTPEQQARLFTPFERLDTDQAAIEGTGIGLALSKRLVGLMHGEIGVDSEVGVGSTFWIEVPLATRHALLPAATPAAEVYQDASDSPERWTVLCIEDNPANLRLIERLLARRGDILLHRAGNGETGLEMARQTLPALILLDINLPEMDGYEVLRHLQAGEETRHIPVVAISANAMAKDMERAGKVGFADYLTKPLDVNRFMHVLDKLLDQAGVEMRETWHE